MDKVIPLNNWAQQANYIQDHDEYIFVMGSDWKVKLDELTKLISKTNFKLILKN